ncbi:hypothetical protein KQI61_05790 [Anaerocolumna aminovalerica]|nr:hypothetical protein [Anaerocolumna aminovalerica]MBU5331701.1 hypothetical protein [Anaerocolumna aminovalerica]
MMDRQKEAEILHIDSVKNIYLQSPVIVAVMRQNNLMNIMRENEEFANIN